MKKRFFFGIGLIVLMNLGCYLVVLNGNISAQTQEDTTNYVFGQSKIATNVPQNAVYEQLFRIVNKFEQKAAEQETLGFSNRAGFLRNEFQRRLELDEKAAKFLKNLSNDFASEDARLKNRRKAVLKSKKTEAERLAKAEAIEIQIKNLSLIYREKLQKEFGENKFEKFESFVNEKFASKIKAYFVGDRLFLELSDIMYDEQSMDVFGYAQTIGDGPDNCGQEYLNWYCPWSRVVGVFTSDLAGQIDQAEDFRCGNEAYVDFYISGADIPEETFCIQSEHEYNPNDYKTCPPPLPLKADLYSPSKMFLSEKLSQEVCVTTPPLPNVTGVNFQIVAPNTPHSLPIDSNPNGGGGLRIFPDDDVPLENTNRQTIRVRAGIGEPRAGVTVYFRNFDLDDPSTDMTIDPNGTTENDNNGSVSGSGAGQLSAVSATTNSQGIATVNFTVTMQPGDNFAIAASTDSDDLQDVAVSGIDLLTGSGTSVETNCDGSDTVCRSEMLTVWRRLHIEVDSMGESVQNFVLGNFASGGKIGRFQQRTVSVNTSNSLEPNRFENGRITFGGNSLRVVSNTTNTITVQNIGYSTITIPVSEAFQLFDDDDFNDDDGTNLIGDTGEDTPLRNTDLALLTADSDTATTNILAPIYIRPVYDVVDPNDNNIFQANSNSLSQADTRALFVDRDLRDTNSGPAAIEYWTVYILGSYQPPIFADNDPALESQFAPAFGIADGIPNFPGLGDGSGVLIFQETHNSKEIIYYPNDPSDPSLRTVATTVGHEIGHLLSGQHGDGDIMTDGTGMLTSNQFNPTTVRRIRAQLTHP